MLYQVCTGGCEQVSWMVNCSIMFTSIKTVMRSHQRATLKKELIWCADIRKKHRDNTVGLGVPCLKIDPLPLKMSEHVPATNYRFLYVCLAVCISFYPEGTDVRAGMLSFLCCCLDNNKLLSRTQLRFFFSVSCSLCSCLILSGTTFNQLFTLWWLFDLLSELFPPFLLSSCQQSITHSHHGKLESITEYLA